MTERLILSYKNNLDIFIIRLQHLGYSKNEVGCFCKRSYIQCLKTGVINVFGGSQIRPNIHIDDMTDLYVTLLKISSKTVEYTMLGLKICL